MRTVRVAGLVTRGMLAASLAVVLLWWTIPRVSGTSWSEVVAALAGVTLSQLMVLTALWALGVVAHSIVLTGAMPGLSRRRALTLNLTGSAVANVVPMGGPLAVATNLAMTRVWHVRRSAFAAYTVVTNIWDVIGKLVLPLVALVCLLVAGGLSSPTLVVGAELAVVALALVVSLVLAALVSDRASSLVARGAGTVAHRLLPSRFRDGEALVAVILHTRAVARDLIVRGWLQLTTGMSAYLVLQALLLGGCLHVAGADLPWPAVLAGFAVERLLTVVVITPGGTGLAEGGAVAVLCAVGGDPTAVAVGVLLYRGFIFLLEIPVGGLWLGGWALTRWCAQARAT
ncbi:lysylphosphatidylglycerol synthase transmembrane domain-containing protein [Pedococcus sp. 5OH_020]|uniref:lysylphosphatidylglycerol synthase transmembrane domain-containing protein n=1 Tax=Pedococcus sp. 5OH_020 TaxID=2989814 RepID=UPI0022E9C8FA|nr:lysylphosphatidylglycerol synthase domain-containing protein [Pedococcus sp. 5OH_020]